MHFIAMRFSLRLLKSVPHFNNTQREHGIVLASDYSDLTSSISGGHSLADGDLCLPQHMDDLFGGISLSKHGLASFILHPNPNLRSGTDFGGKVIYCGAKLWSASDTRNSANHSDGCASQPNGKCDLTVGLVLVYFSMTKA